MKTLVALCLLAIAPLVHAAPSAFIKGEVLEVKEVESYTYLRLKTKDGETWAAVSKAPVKKGATVTVEDAMTMTNFESKSLHKTFPKIVFGSLAGAAGSPMPSDRDMAKAHSGIAKPNVAADVKVPKASGANAYTVAEIATKGTSLKDKPVVVRGMAVKYNGGIMGKNWVHLRDGSGSAADGSNDILVTTQDQAKVGDVVTVKGTVRTDKDFGSGYAYKVLVEDAKLQK